MHHQGRSGGRSKNGKKREGQSSQAYFANSDRKASQVGKSHAKSPGKKELLHFFLNVLVENYVRDSFCRDYISAYSSGGD